MLQKFLTDGTTLVDWLTAIGTLLAVIVALFAARIERWWRGYPKLNLIIEPNNVLPPDREGKVMIVLPIENTGTYLAEQVEVFVKSIHQKDPLSGSYEQVKRIVPMSLRWNHSESSPANIFVTISSKMQRYCILGALKSSTKEPNLHTQDDNVYFELWTEHKRSATANELLPGRYQIEILLAAAEMSPQRKMIWLTVPPSFELKKIDLSEYE